jgi:hypothetical protein
MQLIIYFTCYIALHVTCHIKANIIHMIEETDKILRVLGRFEICNWHLFFEYHIKQRLKCLLKALLVQHSATGLKQELNTSRHIETKFVSHNASLASYFLKTNYTHVMW